MSENNRISIPKPPGKVENQGVGNALMMVIPMMGSIGMMVFMATSRGGDSRYIVMAGVMAVGMLSMAGFNMYRQISGYRQKVDDARREYLADLSETRKQIRTAISGQLSTARRRFPDPQTLASLAEEGSRVWERSETGMLSFRVGTRTEAVETDIDLPGSSITETPDLLCQLAGERLYKTYQEIEQVPCGIGLPAGTTLFVHGGSFTSEAFVRGILSQVAFFTSCETVQIAILAPENHREKWDWVKWLPHCRSLNTRDQVGPARMVVSDQQQLETMLGLDQYANQTETIRPELVLIITDQAPLTAGFKQRCNNQNLNLIEINLARGNPNHSAQPTGSNRTFESGQIGSPTALALQNSPLKEERWIELVDAKDGAEHTSATYTKTDGSQIEFLADLVSIVTAQAVCRRLTAFGAGGTRTAGTDGNNEAAVNSNLLTDLLRVPDVRDFDPTQNWQFKDGDDRLKVPFGTTPEGKPVTLDFKESAQGGVGPHGLMIGATGSGKSEVLRTLVLALALTHSPEQLNFVLVDFKGGATFAGMADLPHVSAMISNLESELSLVDRMQDALVGEMSRRQTLLRDAGNYANVTDYEQARLAGKHNYPPLAALLIILDEFSEMLTAKPEFGELFTAIGRLGRSMSIHLLLATQKLDDGKIRGLESHLSYRIGLKTFSAAESRAVIGVNDAYELPSLPGSGFLKTGTETLVRFRASYVASPPPPRFEETPKEQPVHNISPGFVSERVFPFTSEIIGQLERISNDEPLVETVVKSEAPPLQKDLVWADSSQIDIAVRQMAGATVRAHQVWLPPLDSPDTLDMLLGKLERDPRHGLFAPQFYRQYGPEAQRTQNNTQAEETAKLPCLQIPLGVTDVPREQRREVTLYDLAGAGGHFATVGSARSGKSTVLRSLVMSLSLLNSPLEVQFYILDFGGGTFAPFKTAAHVAGFASRDNPEIVRRMLAEIANILDIREKYFRTKDIDSMDTYRRMRAKGEADDGYGDIFLVIDGWEFLRSDFDGVELQLQTLAARSLAFGVHLLTSSSRWMDFRQQTRDLIGSRLELKLGDATDSIHGRRVAETIPAGKPGRGMAPSGNHMLVCLPRIDGSSDDTSMAQGVKDALTAIRHAWTGPQGPKLRQLPEILPMAELQAEVAEAMAGNTLQSRPGGSNISGSGLDSNQLLLGLEETLLAPVIFDTNVESHLYLLGDSKSGKTTFLRSLITQLIDGRSPAEVQIAMVDYRRSLLGEIPEEYLIEYMPSREKATEMMSEIAGYLHTRIPGDSVTVDQLRERSWWSGAELWVLVDDYDLVATQTGNPLTALEPLLAQAGDIGLHLVLTRRLGGASRSMYETVMRQLTDLGTTAIMLSGDPDEGQIIGKVKPVRAVPGRAQIISRDRGLEVAQLAWAQPIDQRQTK